MQRDPREVICGAGVPPAFLHIVKGARTAGGMPAPRKAAYNLVALSCVLPIQIVVGEWSQYLRFGVLRCGSPLPLRLDNQLDHFTNGALAARTRGNKMGGALHFRNGVGNRGREAHA
jgi:hypothetical protein